MKKLKLAMLPPMVCETGCGRCCGIVPVTETEFQRIGRYVAAHGIAPVDQGPTCPLYQAGGCTVYPVRPLICQVYGHIPELPCVLGHNVNVEKRQVDRLIAGNGKPTKLLHELIPGFVDSALTWAVRDSLSLGARL